tara:strand:- start:98 stop:469 length:372 start_codon:yes stop_codon:yes gene_type:complete
MSDKTYITFIDNAGRSILGVAAEDTADTLKVDDPVMVLVQQQENGQMAVQLYPLFFAEFIKPAEDGSRATAFTYNKATLAIGTGFDLDPRIIEQYEKIINPTLVPVGDDASGEDAEVIKLFDE